MDVHNQGPTLGSEYPKTESKKIILNISSANSRNLSVISTNADNRINKRSELVTTISAETIPKHTHLSINECELQVHDYDCFSNTTDSNYHSDVVICVKNITKTD